jgi:putative transposase
MSISIVKSAEMQRVYGYRIYPSETQKETLDRHLHLCRKLYNAALEERITWYKEAGISLRYIDQCKELPELKKALSEYRGVYAQVLQSTLRRLDGAFESYFNRVAAKKAGKKGKVGFPRFKGRNRFKSILYPQYKEAFSILPDGNLRLPKVGDVRMVYHRPIEGKIKTLSIKRDAVGDWWAIFSCEFPDVPKARPKTAIGVDVGLENLVTLSTGETVAPPKFLCASEERIKKLQRKLSRKEMRSERYEKARVRLAKAQRKVADQRKDFLHKLSKELIKKADVIAFEDLRIDELMINNYRSKSIGDAGWGMLMRFTNYKAESAGKFVKFVDAHDTSILCASCGAEVPKRLDQRLHFCQDCGFKIDRDWNAALNIEARIGPDGAELVKKLVEAMPTPSLYGGGEHGQ